VVIAINLLGFCVTPAIQSIVSNAADAKSQGQTMGAVASLSSLMAVLGPVLGAPLMGAVSHLPPSDWRVGAPFYFCAALQMASMLVAWRHFSNERRLRREAELAAIKTTTAA
jgi:MFS transporter, DHA1 family, tetracycline resistance protein